MTKPFARWLALIALVGFALRVGYVLVVGPHFDLGADAIWYQLQAGTLADGVGYVDPDAFYRLGQAVPTANFPPLWSMLLAVPVKLGFDGLRQLQVFTCLLGATTVVLTGLAGRKLVNAPVGLVAAGIVACSPSLMAADGSLMAESLFIALVTGAALVALHVCDEPRWGRVIGLGVLLGSAALTRSDGLVIAVLMVGAVMWRLRKRPAAVVWRTAGVALAVVGLVMAPWIAIATTRTGSLVVLSNNAGSVIEGGNCPSTYRGDLIGGWDPACLSETRAEGRTEAEWSADARRAGMSYATRHAARLPIVAAVRVLRVFGLWEPIGQAHRDEAVESRSPDWQVLAWAYDLTVLALAVAGAVRLRRDGVPLAVPAAVVAAVVIMVIVSVGNPRQRLVAEPQLAVMAAAAVVASFERVRSRT